MKKMKHGGKARKSHKRMQDGGIASFGGMPASLDQRPGMYRPVGRPGSGGATGYQAGGGMTSDIGSVPMGRGGAEEAQPVRLPGRGGGMSGLQQQIVGVMGRPLERPGMKGSPAAIMGRPGRGGAMTSDAGLVPMGRGGAMPSAISRGIASGAQPMGLSGSIGGATGYQAGGGMTSDADSVPMGRGFRKGGAVKGKKMAAGGIAHRPGKPSTISNRPAGSGNSGGMYRPVGRPPSAAGHPSTVKPSSPGRLRGGGLARKGVGMALAKGGLAKRAGGCAKRGVGRGKVV